LDVYGAFALTFVDFLVVDNPAAEFLAVDTAIQKKPTTVFLSDIDRVSKSVEFLRTIFGIAANVQIWCLTVKVFSIGTGIQSGKGLITRRTSDPLNAFSVFRGTVAGIESIGQTVGFPAAIN
jgi:hypothetical protein